MWLLVRKENHGKTYDFPEDKVFRSHRQARAIVTGHTSVGVKIALSVTHVSFSVYTLKYTKNRLRMHFQGFAINTLEGPRSMVFQAGISFYVCRPVRPTYGRARSITPDLHIPHISLLYPIAIQGCHPSCALLIYLQYCSYLSQVLNIQSSTIVYVNSML